MQIVYYDVKHDFAEKNLVKIMGDQIFVIGEKLFSKSLNF